MHILDLLEKRERAIYQLFLLLRKSVTALGIKEAAQELHLSKSTLLRYIESFSEEVAEEPFGLVFQIREEEILLHRGATLSIQDLFAYLCRTSVKYQILLYFFDKNECSIPMLAQDLLLSEATLNRHLSSINQFLKEFQVTIRSGRLRGSELQIRYLYYHLFWLTRPLKELEKDRVFVEQLGHLPIFERFYQSPFNPRQAHQLALWLMIVQKRMRLKDLDFQAVYQLMAPYEQHKFYRQLRQLFLTLSQQSSASFQEGDTMSVFAFLFSQGILAAHQLEQVLGFGGPIMAATSWAFQQVKVLLQTDLAVEEGELYHLNQVFSQLYFFTSCIESGFDELGSYEVSVQMAASSILRHVSSEIFGRKEEVAVCHLRSLSQLFSYFMQVEPAMVQIGWASSYPSVISSPILQVLRQSLERNRSIQIEPVQPDQSYDLVICHDYPWEKSPFFQVYAMPTVQELKDLKSLIQTIHQRKLEQAKRLVERTHFRIERR
ncbi:TPA: helix-turn-helix domain-containing protein [Streptococcus suis]